MKTAQRAYVEKEVASVKAAANDDFDYRLQPICRKGYTTPAEAIFTTGMIEAIEGVAIGLVQLLQALMSGAKNVLAEQKVHA